MIVERNRSRRRREHDRPGDEVLRRRTGKLRGRGSRLGDRHIARGPDKAGELVVGHLELIHPEPVDSDPMNRPGVGHGVGTAVR